jgi:CheY-like chemotaxis protein
VLLASDGAEAIRVDEQHNGRIDLLITDMVMPGMSGLELARSLSRTRPGLKALYTSGYTDAMLHQGILEEGTFFLAKPFTREALTQKVRAMLEAQGEGI